MQKLERIQSLPATMLAMQQSQQAELWTALPGIIQSFNPITRTCEVKPSIKVRLKNIQYGTAGFTGSAYDYTELPLLLDCPVVFPSGGGFTLTFPLRAGDECLVVFASRSIDGWWALGGLKNSTNVRMHDLSDGFVIAGVNSKPNVIPSISTSSTQLRSDDGATYVDVASGVVTVHATTVTVNSTTSTINASGGATVNANTQINGNLIVSGSITDQNGAHGTLQHVRDNYNVHTHTDPQGGSVSGPSNSL